MGPSVEPSGGPSVGPSGEPSEEPSERPSDGSSGEPSEEPSVGPSEKPNKSGRGTMNRSLVLPLLIVAFSATDTLTTVFVLKYLGGTELNPVYHLVGPGAFWIFKWIAAFGLAAVAHYALKRGWGPEWRFGAICWAMIPAWASMSNAIVMAVWSWGF